MRLSLYPLHNIFNEVVVTVREVVIRGQAKAFLMLSHNGSDFEWTVSFLWAIPIGLA
jgi:hypothetical protein